ncbi:MAG: 2-C-methyl-D-erythritol 4-phosphate cytidylyltransferase [Bacillota bacterium]|nr:2-C-methyl-D-erythritol 4-phosphate cytidylyltransferase [Bacillota bacterium]
MEKKILNYALIVAGGKGTRMGSKVSKQFLNLAGRPVLYHTLKVFSECKDIHSIILVVSREDMEFTRNEIVGKYNFTKVEAIVEGGRERQHSVYNGLEAIGNCNVVLIHDGARPFINEKIIKDGIIYAEKFGACACGVRPKDTIKVIDSSGFSADTPDRDTLIAVQTPQAFRYELIMNCHRRLMEEGIRATDDTMVAERYGHRVYLYEGDYKNIKITTPEDMLLGEEILRELS